MKIGYTHIAVLLDRSGSMAAIKDDTEGGFGTFLAEQKGQPGDATIELRQFDHDYEVVYSPTPIQDAAAFVLEPRGSTALLDAMGKAITATGEWLRALDESERPERVIFVIITDGKENSSSEWSRRDVFTLVKEQTDIWKWTFIYLGAHQDAIAVGSSLGIPRTGSLTYTGQTVNSTYSTLSRSVGRTRFAGASAGAFTDSERKQAGG